MQRHLTSFKEFLREAKDPSYYQETFYFTMLVSMTKDKGGSRDETKNDIRALPEVLTVTLVEREKGGVQKDLGTKYLSTLKVHVRRPRDISKDIMMKRIVKMAGRLTGVSVLRYKERKPKQRKKVFRGPGSYKITEGDYQKLMRQKSQEYASDKHQYLGTGPQNTGGTPFKKKPPKKRGRSAPPIVGSEIGVGGAFGLEEAHLDEAMKTAADLPEDVVVVVRKGVPPEGFAGESVTYKVYFALRDSPKHALKPGDLDRLEAGIDIYGVLMVSEGRSFPYEGVYIVTSSKVKDGYGPLLYDVAMETAGKAGLKPDTLTVSEEASAVWKHYDSQREDVDSSMLVMDIDQYELVMPDDRAANQEENEHLAKAYFKLSKDVTEELKSRNQLVGLYDGAPQEKPKAPTPNKDLSRFDRLYEDILITIAEEQPEDDLMAFDIQPDLNQKIWDGDREVRPGVKGALMDIVDEFLEGLDMDLDVKDVVVTGSIANYNWSKFSDIDLHILMDFGEVNENKEMVKKFFDAVRSNWNKLHNILIKGHEVEIYVQDEHEPHISTGVYSLTNDRWLVKPKKVRPAIDRHTATKKMKQMAREIDKLGALYDNREYQASFDLATKIKEKLKKMRRSGLDRSGIYAPENLAFKMLRRSSGDIEQLFGTYTQSYDKLHSVDQ